MKRKAMKSRQEILDKIKEIGECKKDFSPQLHGKQRILFEQFANAAINALKFALGYDYKHYYWCMNCNIPHPDEACPRCLFGEATK